VLKQALQDEFGYELNTAESQWEKLLDDEDLQEWKDLKKNNKRLLTHLINEEVISVWLTLSSRRLNQKMLALLILDNYDSSN
jgi:hypothetical protein